MAVELICDFEDFGKFTISPLVRYGVDFPRGNYLHVLMQNSEHRLQTDLIIIGNFTTTGNAPRKKMRKKNGCIDIDNG